MNKGTRPTAFPPQAVATRVVLAVLFIAAVVVLFLFNPGQHAFYPFCMFHKTTGLLCPGCGSLRAVHELMHGNLRHAFKLNPLLVASLPFVAVWTARNVARNRRGEPVSFPLEGRWLALGFVLLVLFGVMRNLRPFAEWLS